MTNREWLSSLSNEELAKVMNSYSCSNYCINGTDVCGDCVKGITEWLNTERIEPMPELRAGDYIFYEYSDVIYRAFCISGKLIFLIDRGVCTRFDGEIKQRTVAIKRYNITKETMEDIWRADNE